jgi:glycosyltransferase involved in cell wall biosynthesis
MQEPLISVVIPCYNDGRYLPETLERLSKQTYSNFEIIIVNDGSTDAETLKILDQLASQGGGIQVLHKKNGRMSSARNHGAAAAKGEILVALDADDYFDPQFFKKGLEILTHNPNAAVVTSHLKMFGENTAVSKPRGGDQYNFLFSSECPACAMVRKSCWDAVGGYDEAMTLGYEDWEFYIRITQKGWTVAVIPEILFYYRQTQKSTHRNSTIPNREKIIQYIVEKHASWYLSCLVKLIADKQVLYTERRTAYATIFKLLADRLKGKYQ